MLHKRVGSICIFKLPPRCKCDFRSPVMLCSVGCQLFTDVSGQPISLTFKGPAAQAPLKMRLTSCAKTFVRNYQSTLRNISEEGFSGWTVYCVLPSQVTRILRTVCNGKGRWDLYCGEKSFEKNFCLTGEVSQHLFTEHVNMQRGADSLM